MNFLYHGTSANFLKPILKKGLRARRPASKGNFPDLPSGHGRVYLSDTFALYYAFQMSQRFNRDAVLVRINTHMMNVCNFRPDEDYIAADKSGSHDFAQIRTEETLNKHKRILMARKYADEHPELSTLSLEKHGTVAYKGKIYPTMFAGIAIVPKAEVFSIIMQQYDPCPGILSASFLGSEYRQTHSEIFEKYRKY